MAARSRVSQVSTLLVTASLTAAALLTGCGPEVRISTLEAYIAVSPSELAFGEAAVPQEHELTLFVSNAGKAPLDVAMTFEPQLGVFSFQGDAAFQLGPDDAMPVVVVFEPTTYLPYATEIVLRSNDEETPVVRVPVSGTGVFAPQPDIDLSTSLVDVGVQSAGGATTGYFEIDNLGDAPLILEDVVLEGSPAFSLFEDPSGDSIGAGASLPVIVEYAPTDQGGDQATLTIPSNDPDEPEVQVILIGNGGDGFELPVAVIDCPVGAAPPEYVTLDGTASYDPGGTGITSYVWTLIDSPAGSQASFTSASGPVVQLFADSAGFYEVGLTVFNGLLIESALATCVFEAVPADALHVELTWDGASSDLDLHLIRDAGVLFDSPDDASWCNSNPSWGPAGSDDDPRLDLDDLAGLGPENINILLPADGQYHAAVHYYGDDYDGAVTATVRVYLLGALVSEQQQVMNEFDVWYPGSVDWPAATWTPDDTSTTSRLTDCF